MKRVPLFGIEVDPLTMVQAVQTIRIWLGEKEKCRTVVTPNTDSILLLHEHAGLCNAYHNASLVLVDGNPVMWAARLLGKHIPERVAGSDLVPALFKEAQSWGGLRVFLMGAGPGVAARASERIKAQWPWINVCGSYSPAIAFEKDNAESERMVQMIASAKPQVLVIGLGAPKQELWIEKYRERIEANAVLCVGAAIDFLAGEKKRAPLWMQKLCMEWLHRLLSEPRRLARRYARDAWIFPRLVMAELIKQKNKAHR